MKKLSTLIFALLFTAGLAFGQNNSSTSQNGANNEVTVLQTYRAGGSNTANGAVTSQIGDNNKILHLSQVGAGNEFDVNQKGDNNIVSIHPDQGDANNSNSASFDGNIQVQQSGNSNKVFDADQVGYGNQLTINQGDVQGGGNNNIVNIEAQVNMSQGSAANVINISQLGDGNVVGGYGDTKPGAYQEGHGNSMNISQAGGAKAGTQHHGTDSGNRFDPPTATYFRPSEGGQGLIQLGNTNSLTLDQSGDATVGFSLQEGQGNTATINQSLGVNSATNSQVGGGNTATVTQGGGVNNATVYQVGGGNSSTITQN